MRARKFVILVVFAILISSLNLAGVNYYNIKQFNENKAMQEITYEISFSKPCMMERGSYINLSIENCNSFLVEPGFPILPKMIRKIDLPLK